MSAYQFNKEFLPETKKHGGAEPQSLVSDPNIPGLHSKSLHNAYDVKPCVLIVAIHLSVGDVKPGGPLGAFRKS